MRKFDLKLSNKSTKHILVVISVALLFFISYSTFSIFSSNKEQRYLDNLMTKIKDVNNQGKDFIDNGTLNVKSALKTLPQMRNSLYSIAIDGETSKYSNDPKYASEYLSLSKGLNENILLLDQLHAMLSNPYGKDLELAAESLKIYRDTANSYYNLIKYKNSTFSLGSSMDILVNKSLDYCISSNNSKKIEELRAAEAEKFISTLNELTISLDKLIVNYYERVMECRSNKLTYELLISKIDDTMSKLNSVKTILTQMSIPDDFLNIYNSFSEIVNLYSKYVFDVKYAIVTESVRRDKKDITEDYMDSLYDSSSETLEQVQKQYKNFTKEYNKLKGNY